MTYVEGLKTTKSKDLFEKACKVLPGGVSSAIRTYPVFDPYPIFFDRGKGSKFWDADGNEYIDFVLSLGPLIHGHAPPKIIEAVKDQMEKGTMSGMPSELSVKTAGKIKDLVPNAEMVRFTNTGLEATMHAIRIARGYTGKDKIIKFEGGYHGAYDYCLVSIHKYDGEEGTPLKAPESGGIPEDSLKNTIVLPWNNLDVLEKTIKQKADEIAAVITEPIMMNTGTVPPESGYLEGIREITQENNIVFIMDEIISGFRVALGGAQEYFGVKADLATFGKALGAGFPIAAITGKKEIMDLVGSGKVAHFGTYGGNALCLAAANASIASLEDGGIQHITKMGDMLLEGIGGAIEKTNAKAIVQGLGGAGLQVYFTELKKIRNLREAAACDAEKCRSFHKELLRRGIYFHPYVFEHQFISTAHTEQDIEKTISAATEAFKNI